MVRALFPCGSITAPKIRAMELINQVERDARGPYCGRSGDRHRRDAAFNRIRTLRPTPGENGADARCWGRLTVADSEMLVEWRNTRSWAVSWMDAAMPTRSRRCALPREHAAVELHLERIKASAALGWLDRHAVRNDPALCFDAEQPAAVRLLAAQRCL
jgi:para-aminobenzoate synthetase/4-amino-4-deoxychorismate lyase